MRVSPWFGALAAVAMASSAMAQEDPKAVFQGRYDTLRSAMAAQDQAAVGTILAPGYSMTDIQGEVRDAAGVATMMQRMPPGMGRDAKTTVLEATVSGDTAAIKQQLAAKMARPGPDGAEMTMELEVVSNDTWVKTGDAWQLKASVQKDLTVKRNGDVFFKQSN
jgi:hypothetical protein